MSKFIVLCNSLQKMEDLHKKIKIITKTAYPCYTKQTFLTKDNIYTNIAIVIYSDVYVHNFVLYLMKSFDILYTIFARDAKL